MAKLINDLTKSIRQIQSRIDQTWKNKYENELFKLNKFD
jgi:hypothetical protein